MIQKTNFYKIRFIKTGDRLEIEVEGDREFVEKKFKEFKSLFVEEKKPSRTTTATVAKKPAAKKVKKAKKQEPKGLEFNVEEAKAWLKKQKVKPEEKLAAVVYYLSKNLGRASFKTREIADAVKKLGLRIKNIYFHLNKFKKMEVPLMEKVGRGEWKLTEQGEKKFSEEKPSS